MLPILKDFFSSTFLGWVVCSQLIYDKDTFSTDDFMGEAEIDIQPLVAATKAYETSTITEPM